MSDIPGNEKLRKNHLNKRENVVYSKKYLE